MFPFIDYTSGGSLQGYIDGQKMIANLANHDTKIIPGHGTLASKKDLLASINMLEDAQKIITNLLKKGKNQQEIIAINPLESYHKKWHWQFITTKIMTKQIINGLAITVNE